jgi:conjugative transfer signal peptidase TraF
VLLLTLQMLHFSPPWAINPTPSIPRGFYLYTREQLRRGIVISFYQPPKAGVPMFHPDGIPSLLKYVAAMPGDTIDVTTHGVWVDGRLWPNSQKQPTTRCASLYLGRHVIPAGYVWAMGTNSDSCDSRYFGAVSNSRVISKFNPLPLFGIRDTQWCPNDETLPLQTRVTYVQNQSSVTSNGGC